MPIRMPSGFIEGNEPVAMPWQSQRRVVGQGGSSDPTPPLRMVSCSRSLQPPCLDSSRSKEADGLGRPQASGAL